MLGLVSGKTVTARCKCEKKMLLVFKVASPLFPTSPATWEEYVHRRINDTSPKEKSCFNEIFPAIGSGSIAPQPTPRRLLKVTSPRRGRCIANWTYV
ncbi:hypothetical protein KIN20_006143 [Parelaphostrongylus tenuis]|uniref:Uncharacterized protein n=1 Tax=Parelaphostrongylus tenuis TaxID=148309 RepID=A0AAD5QGI3_PARTN|nr:hypothetical protein KIN20_006143 [Parelaphostrongylus tenuis]